MDFNEEEWVEHRESYDGYCTSCEDWTRDCTEPDATGYDCPDCGENNVVGAEEYLIMAVL